MTFSTNLLHLPERCFECISTGFVDAFFPVMFRGSSIEVNEILHCYVLVPVLKNKGASNEMDSRMNVLVLPSTGLIDSPFPPPRLCFNLKALLQVLFRALLPIALLLIQQ